MIVFDLSCSGGHRFEGWFGSSDDFARQSARGLVSCPQCGSADVVKAPMAPAVTAKSNRKAVANSPQKTPVRSGELPPEVTKAIAALADAQAKALKSSTWVGDKFAEESRAMHYGEKDSASIHGQASLEDAQSLADEGIAVAPLPFPVAPPKDVN